MAGSNIKGIVVEIGGNVTPLQKALQSVNQTSKDLNSELNQVNRLLKLDPKNTELLHQKQQLLAQSIQNTSQKLLQLREAEKQVQQQVKEGKVSQEQYRAFQREIVKAEAEMTRLNDQVKDTNKQVEKSESAFNLFGKMSEENSKKAKDAIAGVSVAVTALLAGLFKLAKDAAYAADEINTLAKTTGLATDTIQKMKYASEMVDVSLDTISTSLVRLTRSMGEAQKGNLEYSKAFSKLRVSIYDSNGRLKDSEKVFYELLEALSKVNNETQRDILTLQLFGRSAMDLNPIIYDGGKALKEFGDEAQRSGLILGQESLDKTNKLADSLDKMKASVQAAGLVIGAEFAEDISEILDKLLTNFAPVLNMVMTLVKLITGIPAPVIAVIATVAGLITAMSGVSKAVNGVTSFMETFNIKSFKTIGIVLAVVAALVALAAVLAVIFGKTNDMERTFKAIGSGMNDMNNSVNQSMQNTKVPRYATGTNYHQGGLALVGEQGMELVNIPRASGVIDHEQTKKLLNGSGSDNFNVQVNVRANDLKQMSDVVMLFDGLKQARRARKV